MCERCPTWTRDYLILEETFDSFRKSLNHKVVRFVRDTMDQARKIFLLIQPDQSSHPFHSFPHPKQTNKQTKTENYKNKRKQRRKKPVTQIRAVMRKRRRTKKQQEEEEEEQRTTLVENGFGGTYPLHTHPLSLPFPLPSVDLVSLSPRHTTTKTTNKEE